MTNSKRKLAKYNEEMEDMKLILETSHIRNAELEKKQRKYVFKIYRNFNIEAIVECLITFRFFYSQVNLTMKVSEYCSLFLASFQHKISAYIRTAPVDLPFSQLDSIRDGGCKAQLQETYSMLIMTQMCKTVPCLMDSCALFGFNSTSYRG